MSVANQFVTSANKNYSLYITREETIQALSSIVPALSSLNFSSILFQNPNPSFSTISMNPNGQINGFPLVTAGQLNFVSSAAVGNAQRLDLANVGGVSNVAITSIDTQGNCAPLQGNLLTARQGSATGTSVYQQIGPTGNTFFSANGGGAVPYVSWNTLTGANARIALSNISSINGTATGTQITTYTSLTGSNITNSQVITTPALNSVSSINGSNIATFANNQQWVVYTVTNTGTQACPVTANTPFQALSFSNIPISAPAVGKAINISVPIAISPQTTPSGQVNILVTAYVGGGVTGGTGVCAMVSFSPASVTNGKIITLSGTAICNGNQPVLAITITSDVGATFNVVQATSPLNRFYFQQIV